MASCTVAGAPLSLLLLLVLVTAHGVAGDEVTVTFRLTKKVALGREIVIVGGQPELGNWSPAAGLRMHLQKWTENEWTVSTDLDLREKTVVEYKPVITDYGSGNNTEWYPGYNLAFEIPDEEDVEIPIIWPDSPVCPMGEVM